MWYAVIWLALGVAAAYAEARGLKKRHCMREIVLFGLLLTGGTLLTVSMQMELFDVRIVEIVYVLFKPLDDWVQRL